MKSNNSIILGENDYTRMSFVDFDILILVKFTKVVKYFSHFLSFGSFTILSFSPKIMLLLNGTIKGKLFFKPINEDFVSKQINKLNIKKATVYDSISPKIIKFAQPVITNPIKVCFRAVFTFIKIIILFIHK
jgi:hypothetical protein